MATFVAPQIASALASSIPTSLIRIVLDYCHGFEAGMSWRYDKMVLEDSDDIQVTGSAFAMRMSDGTVACWGDKDLSASSCKRPVWGGGHSSIVEARLENVKALCSASFGAFAAIVGEENTVKCWGYHRFGGDCSAVAGELKQVVGICGTEGAFAALKKDGTVTTWGCPAKGGDSSSVQSRLKGVKAIYSNGDAFAAVLEDGTVEAWGVQGSGGLIPPSVKERLKQVQCISGSRAAFAALLSDGTVETWGDHSAGANSLQVASKLTQIVRICACGWAFAALRKDGTVVCWGESGEVSVPEGAVEVVAISAARFAFAAIKSDGSVVTWACSASATASWFREVEELKDVVAIRGAVMAFAALRKSGTVVTWGDSRGGGDSNASELKHIVSITAANQAFAARRSDGKVVTWGERDQGGRVSPECPLPLKELFVDANERPRRRRATKQQKKTKAKGQIEKQA